MGLFVALLLSSLTSLGRKEATGKTEVRGILVTHKKKAFKDEGEIEKFPFGGCYDAVLVSGASSVYAR